MAASARTSAVPFVVAAALWACDPAEQLHPGTPDIDDPVPVVSVRNGKALVAWHEQSPDKITTKRYDTATGWAADDATATGTYPEVALSALGRAVMLYTSGSGLSARTMASTGTWSAATTLDSTMTSHSDWTYGVGIDGSGDVLTAYVRGGLRVRTKNWGAAWSAATVLDANTVTHAQIAVNAAGAAIIGYCRGGSLWGVHRDASAGWGAPVGSSSSCCAAQLAGFHVAPVSVGIAESGEGILVSSDMNRVCARRYTVAGGWQGQAVLDAGPEARSPQGAIASSGQAVTAWLSGTQLRVRAFSPGSGWGPVLTDASTIAVGPLGVGITSEGHGAVLAAVGWPVHHVSYFTYSATTGALGAPVDVEAGLATSSYYVRVGFDPAVDYQGMTVWQRAGWEEIWASRSAM